MNIPYKAKIHFQRLKATGAKRTRPDAWENSPNNANYAAFDVPRLVAGEFAKVCAELGLDCGWYGVAGYTPNQGSTMVVAKYVKRLT